MILDGDATNSLAELFFFSFLVHSFVLGCCIRGSSCDKACPSKASSMQLCPDVHLKKSLKASPLELNFLGYTAYMLAVIP